MKDRLKSNPRTRCENGHNMNKEGRYTRPDGYVVCRRCLREADARRREKNQRVKNNPALLLLTVDKLRVG